MDEGLFVLRAVVVGVEGEPLRVVRKTRRRNRRVRTEKAKMRYTVLRVCELRVLGVGGRDEESVGGEEKAVEDLVRE